MSRDALWYFSLPYVGTPTALSSWSLAAWHREIIAKKRKARSMLTAGVCREGRFIGFHQRSERDLFFLMAARWPVRAFHDAHCDGTACALALSASQKPEGGGKAEVCVRLLSLTVCNACGALCLRTSTLVCESTVLAGAFLAAGRFPAETK